MARGWESKAVEDQINAAEAKSMSGAKRSLTLEQLEQRRRIEALEQERSRLIREMEEAHKRRYLVLLERALEHVESELARLNDQHDVSN
jgi:hypothetical protein